MKHIEKFGKLIELTKNKTGADFSKKNHSLLLNFMQSLGKGDLVLFIVGRGRVVGDGMLNP